MQELLLKFLSEEILGDSADGEIGPGDDLLGSGRVDSLGMMRLAAFVEEQFGYRVPPQDFTIENFQSIELLTAYLSKNVGESSTSNP